MRRQDPDISSGGSATLSYSWGCIRGGALYGQSCGLTLASTSTITPTLASSGMPRGRINPSCQTLSQSILDGRYCITNTSPCCPCCLVARCVCPAAASGIYIFTVTVSKDSRSASASVYITAMDSSPPAVSITPLDVTKVRTHLLLPSTTWADIGPLEVTSASLKRGWKRVRLWSLPLSFPPRHADAAYDVPPCASGAGLDVLAPGGQQHHHARQRRLLVQHVLVPLLRVTCRQRT